MDALTADVEGAVMGIVANIYGREPAELTLESPFYEDIGSDSIELLDLSLRLEKHFGMYIPVNELVLRIAGGDGRGLSTPERRQQIQEKFTVGVIVRLVEACLRNDRGP